MIYPYAEIKNIDTVDQSILGTVVIPTGIYVVPDTKRLAIADNENIFDLINADKLIVRNGEGDITTGHIAQHRHLNANTEVLLDSYKRQEVTIRKPEGRGLNIATHDYAEETSWYTNSVEILGESLGTTGDTKIFTTAFKLIDLTHGKVYKEGSISNQRIPVIYDNAVEVTSGYTIDYTAKTITFDAIPTGPVTADYYKPTDNTWIGTPPAGKEWGIEHSELQFASNLAALVPGQELQFRLYADNPYYDPEVEESPTNPVKVVVYETIYKSIRDVVIGSNDGQGVISAVADLLVDAVVLPFHYTNIIPVKSSLGMDIRISISGGVELNCDWAVTTLYLSESDEIV